MSSSNLLGIIRTTLEIAQVNSMKIQDFFGIGILWLLASHSVLAQEMSGNFWINPQTGEVQTLDFSDPNAVAKAQAEASRWVNIATTVQGNDQILVDTWSRVEVASGRNAGMIRFTTKTVTGRGRSSGYNRYMADCENFDLSTDGNRMPIEPGTVGAGIYNWACPNNPSL